MKMTEKTKKYLAIGASGAVCIGLLAAIGLQLGKPPAKQDKLPEQSSIVSEIVVDPSKDTSETNPVIKPNDKETNSLANGQQTAEQPVDNRPPQTDQTQQSIQPDVAKPKPPSQQALTDPTQKPDGTKVDTPPEPVEHEKVEQPQELPPQPNEPQAGDTENGKIYIPGFGWVEDHGGGRSGIVADDMYENGNKIGIMG